MADIDKTTELATLSESNAKRLAALMDGAGGTKVSLPKGFIEQMQSSIYLEHIARALGVETDAKLDFEDNLQLIITDMEQPRP